MTTVPRSHLIRFAQLAAVWGYAVSQPVFSFLEGNPDFLVLRQPTTLDAFAFAAVVAFGPPLLAAAYAALAGLVSRWVGAAMFLAALAGFLVPLAFQVDYWDELGWKDPYSSVEWTRRQRDYGRAAGKTGEPLRAPCGEQ